MMLDHPDPVSLIGAEEQACFARFAVFTGGATVPAAETITGAGLNTLDGLLAKSLLVRGRPERGHTRLGMLETAHAYAAERFAALPDCEAVRERHFTYFLDVARRSGIDSALDGPNGGEHLACLDAELENLRAALRWADERDDADRVLALSTTLVDYWMRRGRTTEAADGSSPRCGTQCVLPIRRCAPARSARRSGPCGISGAPTSCPR